jgi:hypothetical protein
MAAMATAQGSGAPAASKTAKARAQEGERVGEDVGAPGYGRGGSRWPSHVRQWPNPRHHRRRGAPATEAAGKGAREVQHDAEKMMPRTAEDEEVWSNEVFVAVSSTRPSMAGVL